MVYIFYSYEVLQYPLTDFIVEEDEQADGDDEDMKDEIKDGKDAESDGQSVFARKQSVLSTDTSQDLSQSQDVSQGKQSITTLDTGEYHISISLSPLYSC